MVLSREETIAYVGGGKLTAALLSAATSLVKSLYEMGQNLGSTIRRIFSGNYC